MNSYVMSDLVIKVKYGETLRRYSVYVQEDGSVDLNMAQLTAKVLDLFKFSPDADTKLTYIDEDNDSITLVDDDDLHDAFRQCLNPLRINVLLNATGNGRYERQSSGSSSPMRSPLIKSPLFPNITSAVTEVLKSVPAPLHDVLSKLYNDLAAKAASSVPAMAEFLEFLSKLELNKLKSFPQCKSGAHLTTQGAATEKKSGDVHIAKDSNANLTDDKKQCDNCSVTRGAGASVLKPAASMDLNLNPKDSTASGFLDTGFSSPAVLWHNAISANQKDIQKDYNGNLGGKPGAWENLSYTLPGGPLPSLAPNASKLSLPIIYPLEEDFLFGGDKQLPSGSRYSSVLQGGFNPHSKCPFRAGSGAESSDVPPGGLYRHRLSKRSSRIFHKDVRCNACWVYPITGPWFKSKVKENYDLCGICYSKMGNKDEYVRMDRPMSLQSSQLFKKLFPPRPSLPHMLQVCRAKQCQQKLDSCFIEDVNVIDGTMMAPETQFTKIWRIRNNGTIAWPCGTHLVWIGGAQFSDKVLVELEIPVDGIPVDKELDVAVEFKAPLLPGGYVSYWGMESPSGEKFGQQVWVLIQVSVDDASSEGSIASSSHGLNLNLPPYCSETTGTEIIDVNVEPADSAPLESGISNIEMESARPVVDKHPSKDRALEFPVDDSLLVGVKPGGVPRLVSDPVTVFPEQLPESSSVMDMETSSGESEADIEKTLLKELEEMGFKQVDVNKDILRNNDYNLEQCVDGLCGFSEWDPILDELKAMGFCDTETNKKLLMKNAGSITRVVMDLVAGESRVDSSSLSS